MTNSTTIDSTNYPLFNSEPSYLKYNLEGFSYIKAGLYTSTNYKKIVGEFIFDYVMLIVGKIRAPKVTGMLIDLKPDAISIYL